MSPVSTLYAVAFLAYACLATLVIIKNPRSALNWTCALILACMAVWSFTDIFHNNPHESVERIRQFANIGALGWSSFASSLLLFTLILTRHRKVLRTWFVYPLLVIPPVLIIYLQWTDRLAANYVRCSFGWVTLWGASPWPILYYLYYLSFSLFSVYLLLRFRHRGVNRYERHQAGLIAATSLATVLLGTVTNVILPKFAGILVPELAGIFGLIWAAGLYVGVTRYGLMSLTPQAAAGEILSAMDDALLFVSPEGRTVFVNQAAQVMTGYGHSELVGKAALDLFVRPEQFLDTWAQVTKDGSLARRELGCRTKDGREIPVALSARVMRDRSGGAVGIIWVLRDITERKQAEAALRRAHDDLEIKVQQRTAELASANEAQRLSEEKYRAVVENANEGILVAQDGVIKFLNPRMVELLGWPYGEVINRPFVGLIHPDDRAILAERHERRLRGEELPRVYPFRIIRQDGSTGWLEINAIRIAWEGRPATLTFVSDITERRQADEALRKSEERFRLMAEHVSDIIWIADMSLRYSYISPAVERLSGGFTVQEVMSRPVGATMTPESYDKVLKVLAEWQAAERIRRHDPDEPMLLELEYPRKDGSIVPAEIKASVLRDAAGHPIGFVGITRDTTERKRVEGELARHQHHLEELVEERTKELKHAQEESNRNERMATLGWVAGRVARELSEPLAALGRAKDSLKAAAPRAADAATLSHLEAIGRETRRVSEVITGLLDFARAPVPEPGACGLDEIIAEAIERSAMPPEVVLKAGIPFGLPPVHVDRAQIVQVFVSLLTYDRRAMDGHGAITITARQDAERELAPTTVVTTIADTGPGLAPDRLRTLLEPMLSPSGAGIGLPICKSYVEANQGTIAVESEPGRGTLFTIRLPTSPPTLGGVPLTFGRCGLS